MLSLGSLGVLLAGPSVIGYLPICVVAALIFILGFDLVKEALWDTYGRVSTFEYGTIWIIVAVMTIWDFTIGLAVGLILACVRPRRADSRVCSTAYSATLCRSLSSSCPRDDGPSAPS